jgi:hypothetical protein
VGTAGVRAARGGRRYSMRLLALFAGAVATVTACGGRQAVSNAVDAGDAALPSGVTDGGGPADTGVPPPLQEHEAGVDGAVSTEPTDSASPQETGYATSSDGGVCPVGMTLCEGCRGALYCADTCPLPCLPPTVVPTCPAGISRECVCYATTYCGSDCDTACDPRPADSGWCSGQYGAVRAGEADATAATPCRGVCIQMLQLDAAANGEIPVAYGCQLGQ